MYDINTIRKQFPMLNNNVKMQNKPLVFLDNCSTTFKPQCVIDAEMEYYTLIHQVLSAFCQSHRSLEQTMPEIV